MDPWAQGYRLFDGQMWNIKQYLRVTSTDWFVKPHKELIIAQLEKDVLNMKKPVK